jgi:hypothetical protein
MLVGEYQSERKRSLVGHWFKLPGSINGSKGTNHRHKI